MQMGQKVSAKVASQRITRGSKPEIRSKNGEIIIKHREFINDIYGAAAFTIEKFVLNPANEIVFPWAYNMAQMFESYDFLKLHFVYETQKSTSTNGTVLMAVDYDAAEDSPINKQELMAYKSAVRGPAWGEFRMICEPIDLHKFVKERYTHIGDTYPSNTDKRNYDVGNLFVAVQGMSDTTVIGELYVEYELRLRTPQIPIALFAYNSGYSTFDPLLLPNATLADIVDPVDRSDDPVQQLDWSLPTAGTIVIREPGRYIVSMETKNDTTTMTNFASAINATTITNGTIIDKITSGNDASKYGFGKWLIEIFTDGGILQLANTVLAVSASTYHTYLQLTRITNQADLLPAATASKKSGKRAIQNSLVKPHSDPCNCLSKH